MGLTVLDAGVVIAYLDDEDEHHGAAVAALEEALERNDRLVLPASTLAETLVGPSRRSTQAVTTVRNMIERVPVEIEPLDAEIAVAAAAIRARHRSIELPDALVIATAARLDADRVITTDRKWPTAAQLKITATIDEI